MPFGVRDVPGLHFSEFGNVNDFGNGSATKTSLNLDTIGVFDDILAIGFLLFLWVRYFLTFCGFRGNSGSNLGAFLGYLGTLEIGLKH